MARVVAAAPSSRTAFDEDREASHAAASCCWCGSVRKARPWRIAVLGLDDAGKTTLVHALCAVAEGAGGATAEVYAPPSTRVPEQRSVRWRGIDLVLEDVPGRLALRSAWARCAEHASGVVFVVDATDGERLPVVEDEIHKIRSAKPSTPILVLATKRDIRGALSSAEIASRIAQGSAPRPSGLSFDECSAADPQSVHRAMGKFINNIVP